MTTNEINKIDGDIIAQKLNLARNENGYACPVCENVLRPLTDKDGQVFWDCSECSGHYSNAEIVAMVRDINPDDLSAVLSECNKLFADEGKKIMPPANDATTNEINRTDFTTKARGNAMRRIPEATLQALKNITPKELEVHGVVRGGEKNFHSGKDGYICPFCGSGTHENRTGAFACTYQDGIWKWSCSSTCGKGYDNLHLLAEYYGLNVHSDFQEICRRACDEFGISTYDDQPEPKPRPANPAPTEDDSSLLKKRFDTIANSAENLKSFVEEQGGLWRGLNYETLSFFKCGYLPNWNHSKKTSRSPRVIVPASTKPETANYLARLTVPIETFDDKSRQYIQVKEHDGKKTLFNPEALTAELVVVVEGYIDAMSIWQASSRKIAVVALGSLSGGDLLLNAVDGLELSPRKFIVMFDGEPQGRKKADNLREELIKRNQPAVCRFIYDALPKEEQESFGEKVDANQYLQERGDEELSELIKKIITDTDRDFSALEKEIAAQIDNQQPAEESELRKEYKKWLSANDDPPVAARILLELKDAGEFIDGLNAETFKAADAVDIVNQRKIALLTFYAAPIAEKFYAFLRDAKIQGVAPSEIKASVRKLVTKIKRDQQEYQRKTEYENAQAEIDKRRADYLAKNPSTRKTIADCPCDLALSDDIFFGENGVGIVEYRGKHLTEIVAAKLPVLPTKIIRTPQGATSYEISAKFNGRWRRVEMDGDELNDSRKILRLARDGGFPIDDPRNLTKYFSRIISANQSVLPEIVCYTQTGWHDDKFIYPTPTAEDNYIVRRAGFDYEKDFATRGDITDWKKIFLRACDFLKPHTDQNDAAKIFIGISLAAPIVHLLDLPNLQVHIHGKSGGAKSALMKLSASIFGNPRRLLRTFGATVKNRQEVAVGYCDMPTFCDELETVNGKRGEDSLAQSIYEFAEGISNQANRRDGTARRTYRFRGARVTCAERPLLKNRDQRGAYKRLLQLHCPEKIFPDVFATELHAATQKHFGHFGRMWTDFVAQHKEEIQAVFERVFTEWHKHDGKNREPSLLKTVAIGAVAFSFFTDLITGTKSDSETMFWATMTIAENPMMNLPTLADMDDSTRALDELKSFVPGHLRYFYREAEPQSTFEELSQQAFECYGKIFRNGEIAFLPTALRKIVEDELGFASLDALLAEWASKGYLKLQAGRGYRYVMKLNGRPVNVYHFKAGAILTCDSADDYSDSADEA